MSGLTHCAQCGGRLRNAYYCRCCRAACCSTDCLSLHEATHAGPEPPAPRQEPAAPEKTTVGGSGVGPTSAPGGVPAGAAPAPHAPARPSGVAVGFPAVEKCAALDGVTDQLFLVADAELSHEAGAVALDGPPADVEPAGDGRTAVAFG